MPGKCKGGEKRRKTEREREIQNKNKIINDTKRQPCTMIKGGSKKTGAEGSSA